MNCKCIDLVKDLKSKLKEAESRIKYTLGDEDDRSPLTEKKKFLLEGIQPFIERDWNYCGCFNGRQLLVVYRIMADNKKGYEKDTIQKHVLVSQYNAVSKILADL